MSKPTYVLTRDVVIKAGTVVGEAPDKSERAVPFVSVLQGHGPNATSEWAMPLDEALEQGVVVSQPQGDASPQGNPCVECGADPGQACFPSCAIHATPQVSGGGEVDIQRIARWLYSDYSGNQSDVHCNRLPAYAELSEGGRRKWLDKAHSLAAALS